MVAVGVGAALGAALPRLQLFTHVNGFLADPTSASFIVYDLSTDDLILSPTVVVSGTVNLVADRIGLGQFAAAWSIDASESKGRHRIDWTWSFDGTTELHHSQEFEVLGATPPLSLASGYCLVSDLRDEGFGDACSSDARTLQAIARASSLIERVCDRWFEPRRMTIAIDGSGRTMITVGAPICAINTITVDDINPMPDNGSGTVDLTALQVYNRHITQKLTSPDDRDAPLIEYITLYPGLISTAYTGWVAPATDIAVWAHGNQNVIIDGVFGYTDPIGDSLGVTPDLLRRVCMMLVARDLLPLSDIQGRLEVQESYRLLSERTREQSYQLAPGKAGLGWFTGDAAVDDLLVQFVRPIRLSST